MNKEIIEYIKLLSDNNKIQEILLLTIGKILLENSDSDFYSQNYDKIIHIKDWVVSVIENNEEWKKPRVLTVDALNNAANKYFEKKNNKLQAIKLDDTHEKLIADLGDYYIVQMLTTDALDNESKVMQHCIGHGGYDKKLLDNDYKYLSLRDKFNKAHVTLEITKDINIIQLQGKQNNIPEIKYLEILIPWLMENRCKNIPWNEIGKFYENGEWISFEKISLDIKKEIDYIHLRNNELFEVIQIDDSKEKVDCYFKYIFKYDENKIYFIVNKNKKVLFVKVIKEKTVLEKNMNFIKKNILEIYNEGYEYSYYNYRDFNLVLSKKNNDFYFLNDIPENCEIDSSIYLEKSNIKELPKNLTINSNITLCNCNNFIKFNENLIINGDLHLIRCNNLKKLPNNLIINGHLDIVDCLEELPNNLILNGSLSLLSCKNIKTITNNIIDNLYLNHSDIENLPNNLYVKENFYIRNCKNLKKLPDNLHVGGELTLDGTSSIKMFPDNLKCEELYIDTKYRKLIKGYYGF